MEEAELEGIAALLFIALINNLLKAPVLTYVRTYKRNEQKEKSGRGEASRVGERAGQKVGRHRPAPPHHTTNNYRYRYVATQGQTKVACNRI